MKYSLQILEKQNFFQETQISFPKCIEHQIFLDTQLQLLRVWGYHQTIQSLTSRKRYAQKTDGCGTAGKCISQVLLKHFMQEQEVAIRRLEGVHLLKISGNYL